MNNIKFFNIIDEADGFSVKHLPFITLAGDKIAICNEEGKKILVENGLITFVDDGMPDNEIWYTTLDNNIIIPYTTNGMPQLISNTYENGKGIMKFSEKITNIPSSFCSDYNKNTNRQNLVSITLPNSVIYIGSSAFYNCANLSSIILPDTIKDASSSAFSGTNITEPLISGKTFIYLPSGISTYEIPNGIERIGSYSFDSKDLVTLIMPNSVTELGSNIFFNSSNITNITFSNNISKIDGSVFSSWITYSTKLSIVDNIMYAGSFAIYASGNTNIYSFNFRNSTMYIGDSFSTYVKSERGDCTVSSATFPPSIKYIGNAFGYPLNRLTNVYISDLSAWCKIIRKSSSSSPWSYNYSSSVIGKLYLNNSQITDIVIPNDVIDLADYTFYNLKSLNSITFHNQMKSIGASNFHGCKNLRTITIPESIEHIGYGCFYNTLINRVNISNLSAWCNIKFDDESANPLSIAHHLYMNDSEITNLTIPNDINKIKDYAFYGGTSITSVTLHNSVTYIGAGAFKNCQISSISLPDSVTYVGFEAFNNVTTQVSNSHVIVRIPTSFSGTFTIPNTVTSISSGAFKDCTNLTGVVIPNSITKLEDYTFDNCSGLTSIEIPNSVTSIGACTFSGSGIVNFVIPDSVTHIDTEAFYYGQDWSYGGAFQSITVGGTTYTYDGSSEYLTITLANGDVVDLHIFTYYCFMPGTQITLADRTTKAVEDITYEDELLVWNFDDGNYDTAYPMWITKPGATMERYYILTLDDGTVLRASGANTGHKIYNVDDKTFEGIITIEVGKHVYTETGIKEIIMKECIEEETPYYNLMTERHINCFAEGILTSMRYNNIYPFSDDMKFIKDGREPRPYSEFEAVGISKYWYDGLRLSEQKDSVEKIKTYITKLENKMLPK